MTEHNVKGPGRFLRSWTSLKIFGVIGAGALGLAAAYPAPAAPTVGAPGGSAGSVGRYQLLERTFPVTTGAVSPLLPYDPSVPRYAANLRPTEDARRGVSVDALLLPPGQTDWSKAQTWPCYWQEDFDQAGTPTGGAEWHLRFAPTQVGTWHYEIRAADASGSVTTAPATFTCVASSSKGFVHVSTRDSRYFEYSDGSPFIAAGSNAASGPEINGIMAALHAGGGTGLHRVWIATQGGLGIVGGFNQNTEAQSIAAYSGHVTTEDAHAGRYCLSIPVPSGFGPQIVALPLQPATNYTLTAYIKGVGESHPPALYTGAGVASNVGSPDAHGWQKVRVVFNSGAGGPRQIGLGDYGSTAGHLLVDDITVTNPAGGDLLGGGGSFEWHTNYNQAAAAQLDSIMESAAAQGQYLKLVCVNKFDQAFGSITGDGTPTANWFGGNQSLGGSTDPNADTPVQRLQRYWARYLVARWGYSVALHSLEYVNEMDDYNGIQYAGAQAFAHAVHAYTRDGSPQGRVLCTSSTALNAGGITYDVNFYENQAQYPDIDYKDYHFYPDTSDATRGPALPYDDPGNLYNGVNGSTRETGGGPSGLGRLTFSEAGAPGSLSAEWPLPALQGKGTWTVKYFLRASANAKWAYAPNAQVHLSNLPAGYVEFPHAGVPHPSTTWTEYSGTFTIPDGGFHQGGFINVYGGLAADTPAGTVCEFADVRLIAPDGTVFWRITFAEPRMDCDSASLAQFLAGSKASYSGGSNAKPFVVGETELMGGNVAPSLPLDTSGVFARQAMWAGALSPLAQYTQWWHEGAAAITACDGWRFEGGVERFLQGVPLSNGRFRDLGAVAGPTLRVVGQKDSQDGTAVFWVQNRGTAGDGSDAANWLNLATNPSVVRPVSGTVAIPGLPNGTYRADVWDTSSGQPVDSLPLTTSGGVLTVPISGLDTDAAVKITPSSSASMALHLTASQNTVASGGKVTFTLTYTNQGTSPALGVSLPWPIPDHTRFVSASSGGAYDAAQNTVTWRIGTVPVGGSGSVTLTVAAQ